MEPDARIIRISDEVARAIASGKPVVALETTVIAHGLPSPLNLETARGCEDVIKREGATPASVAIVDGVPAIGLSGAEMERLAAARDPSGSRVEKVGLNNLAAVMLSRRWGATTVASTLRIARLGGVRVFSTGGIGGVHRRVVDSFDVSADLTALASTQMVCVCAGAKAILDLSKTVEQLETLGVPVVGYRTDEFPAFYSRTSGLTVDVAVATSGEAAEVARNHWATGGRTAVLVCAPVPEEFEIPVDEIERAVEEATLEAARLKVRAKALTPFLLARLEKITEGRTLRANRALLVNNAKIAAQIAASLAQIES
jgi:pseudouridine-5'-phosphate glycosidase